MASRRVNLKAILAHPDLRRKLMVSTIQATQAREGIETSPEQAAKAYYVVTEAERATFFDLERFKGGKKGDEDRRHEMFVRALRGESIQLRHDVARRDFGAIDGTPLSYARMKHLGPLFRDNLPIEDHAAAIEQGVASINIEHYVRCWWELEPSRIALSQADRSTSRPWARFSKGGDFCRFYADVHLAMLVDADWETMRQEANEKYPYLKGNTSLIIHPENHYFEEGLTWPRRTQRGFNMRFMPAGCVFADKGPSLFPKRKTDTFFLLGICNSIVAEYVLQSLTSFGSWEQVAVKRLPVPAVGAERRQQIAALARTLFALKRDWNAGSEIATTFISPWVVRANGETLVDRLDAVAQEETVHGKSLDAAYRDLNHHVFAAYGLSEHSASEIEAALPDRPREVVWPQMEGKTAEQKRMEHVWRLLSFAVKRAIEADDDGIVPFSQATGETRLVERVREQLTGLFPGREENQLEVEIVNELKRGAKGYRKCASLDDWLANAYFEYHANLYKNRPIFWHIASSQGTAPFAFGALVHYHRFDKNRMAKLRASYVRDTIDELRRNAGLADKAGHADERLELQAKVEEVQALDKKLQQIQEGQHEGLEGGDRDFRILTPWKKPHERPKGWDPDIDDGVKVNIEPLQKAGVLRV